MIEVRAATRADLPELGRVLGQAFADDPVVSRLQPAGRSRAALFRALARHQHGLAAYGGAADLAVEDGRVVGAALWDAPGYRQPWWLQLRSGPAMARALGPRLVRGMALEALMHEHRPPGDLWYLAQVGAAERGRGAGSALLRHRLEQLDGPAYLESSNAVNLPLYERFGFEVLEEVPLPHGGPSIWPMLRRR